MNTEELFPIAAISPSAIEALVRQARADRAEVMRAALVQVPGLFRRFLAHMRPSRHQLPQSGAWA